MWSAAASGVIWESLFGPEAILQQGKITTLLTICPKFNAWTIDFLGFRRGNRF